jgi:hypothetical protein
VMNQNLKMLREIKSLSNEYEVNRHLRAGWFLLDTCNTFNGYLNYVIAWDKEEDPKLPDWEHPVISYE